MSDVWSDVATACPVMFCVRSTCCCASAADSAWLERMFADTAASIGAAALALAAPPPLIGSARSAFRSTLTRTLRRSLQQVAGVELAEGVRDVVEDVAHGAEKVASGVEHLPGERVERTDHVTQGVDHVAGRTVEDAHHVARSVYHGGAVDQVGHGAEHVAHGVEDLAGQRVQHPDEVPGGVGHIPGRTVEDTDDVARRVCDRRAVDEVVTVPTRWPAPSTTSPLASFSVPRM